MLSILFSFRHTTNEAINNALTRLSMNNFRAARFDLTGTLGRIRSEVFQPQDGDRENVANAVILITDTNSGQDSRQVGMWTVSVLCLLIYVQCNIFSINKFCVRCPERHMN